MSKAYEDKAQLWAEQYGIITYRVKGKYMIYNVSYERYLNQARYTIQHKVDLDTMEETTKYLGRFDKSGFDNR